MKQILFLFVSLLVLSCSNNPVPKPDNLLDEEVMVDIIFDISILQAADGSMPYKLMEYNVEMDKYILDKYKIDSATYRQNQKYYAANARKYKKIYKKVIERLEQEKIKVEQDANKVNGTKGEKQIYVPVE
jgi:D-Tyr-tRNAtyr deacylase